MEEVILNRTQIIQKVVDIDIANIIQLYEKDNDTFYIYQLLMNGFKGYCKYTLKELKKEYCKKKGEME